MHFLQKFRMCQLFMRFIFDNDVRILGIFPCLMHDLPNICRSMGIVQMLVCFAIIDGEPIHLATKTFAGR